MRVEPVTGAKAQADFVDLPWRIYAGDPAWVPPLKSDMRTQMSPRKNPFQGEALIEHFLAYDERSQPVGRVAATVYPRPGAPGWDGQGAFGFFECVDDVAVARALLGAAEGWLAAHGCARVSGPYSYCATQESGLLIDGFETRPTLFQTHNPPYYQRLLRDCGYGVKYRATTYDYTAAGFATSAGGRRGGGKGKAALIDSFLRRRGDMLAERLKLTVRPLDKRHYARDMEIIRNLLNASFAGNEGVLPVSEEVFRFQTEQLKPFVDPSIITIVERDGTPIAFSMLVPDLNPLLVEMNGKLRWRILLTLKRRLRALDTAVVLLMGALPERDSAGMSQLLVGEFVAAAGRGNYRRVATTWVHEDNAIIHKYARLLDGVPVKRYAIVTRAIGSA